MRTIDDISKLIRLASSGIDALLQPDNTAYILTYDDQVEITRRFADVMFGELRQSLAALRDGYTAKVAQVEIEAFEKTQRKSAA